MINLEAMEKRFFLKAGRELLVRLNGCQNKTLYSFVSHTVRKKHTQTAESAKNENWYRMLPHLRW